MSSFTQFYTISIAPNSCANQPVTGEVLSIKYSTGPVRVVTNTGNSILMERGDQHREPDGNLFTLLTFNNDTANTITVEFYAGNTVPQNAQVSVSTFVRTYLQANGGIPHVGLRVGKDLQIPAATQINLLGIDPYGSERKQIIITNLSATLPLKLRRYSGANNRIATIFPLDVWTLETNSDLCLENPDATFTVDCEILEVFYRTEPGDVAD